MQQSCLQTFMIEMKQKFGGHLLLSCDCILNTQVVITVWCTISIFYKTNDYCWHIPKLLQLFLCYVTAEVLCHFSQRSRYEAGVRTPPVSTITPEATSNWVRPKKSFCYFRGGIKDITLAYGYKLLKVISIFIRAVSKLITWICMSLVLKVFFTVFNIQI